MKKLMRKVRQEMSLLAIDVRYALSNTSGASLWEYLLVIALVCVIGGIIIAAVSGNNGIGTLWDTLMDKFKSLINGGTS